MTQSERCRTTDESSAKDTQDRAPLLSETEMLREEEKLLWPNGKPSFRAGLALSGGGVRAATVALGVVQVLAEQGLLARFHYLSTVSGGGYIGTSLSWFWCKKRVEEERKLSTSQTAPPVRFGAQASEFPFQDVDPNSTAESPRNAMDLHQRAVENLKFLRNHGSYLTSGDGIGFAGLIIAVIRTILLSLAVWLPLVVFLFVILEVVDFFLRGQTMYQKCIAASSWGVLSSAQCRPFFGGLLFVASIFLLLFFAGVMLFSILGRTQLDSSIPGKRPERSYKKIAVWLALFVVPLAAIASSLSAVDSIQVLLGVQVALLPLVSAAGLMLAAAEFFSPGRSRSYFLRRSFEKYSSVILPIVVAILFVAALPLIVSNLKPATDKVADFGALGSVGGVVTLLSGVATALYGYYLKAKSLLPSVAGQILATAGSVLFLFGFLLFSFVLAAAIFVSVSPDGSEHGTLITTIFLSLVVVALIAGTFGSVNTTGLHRFYRDRLMEAFMPMANVVELGTARRSDVADNLSVADILRNSKERGDRPYHLINAHAILVNDDDAKIALRGGDNFVISSAVIGSFATGWMRTKDYVRHHGAMTLSSAMAVSGAAANANAGYTGTGLTRDRFVSTVMSLLNIRLGLWVGNPRATAKSTALPRLKAKVATYFRPVLTCGIFGFGHHRDATFVELSDGGHFENLGLYELIRRRLDLIVVVDAEQDSTITLSGLVSSTNRIKEDFGVAIGFLDSKGPEVLLGKDSDRYPSGARLAKSPFVVAEIIYPDGRRGALIYIKSTMLSDLEFATKGYKANNPDFPHQATVDQFFDPDQFEAYRDLGRKSCAFMIKELNLAANFASTSRLLAHYGFPVRQEPAVAGA